MATGFTQPNHVFENLDRDIVEFMFKKMAKEIRNLKLFCSVDFQISDGILPSLCNVTLKPGNEVAKEEFMSLYDNEQAELQATHISWSDVNLHKGHCLLSRADTLISQKFPDVYQIKGSKGVRFVGKGKQPASALEEFRKIVHSQQSSGQSLKRTLSAGDDVCPKLLKSKENGKDEGESSKSKESNEDQKSSKENDSDEMCPICLCDFTEKYTLPNCKHAFCRECIDMASKIRPVCPICSKSYGTIVGNQPINANMTVNTTSGHLPGYPLCGTIEITYSIPSGIQGPEHPQPGMAYHGTMRIAYLPDNTEGNHVLQLLKRAFKQRLIFTVGVSRTTGIDNIVTWNDIHHKTSIRGGPINFGYPDPDYLKRVQDELKEKGIV
uniref:E3 ubiquitin-protein ligase n=2 Tax=Petromyzon marinus TaxID=7757 RepID=A0AAJ7WL77_PETMA|nr:E3 ubiquitin-protein ligase DTX3L-like [Petromyzon marinus]XP_032801846.1 E3 ubiquitin-protein ligase DTX3L-like [Petromyzon marinus]